MMAAVVVVITVVVVVVVIVVGVFAITVLVVDRVSNLRLSMLTAVTCKVM
jgi:hypothetical protein